MKIKEAVEKYLSHYEHTGGTVRAYLMEAMVVFSNDIFPKDERAAFKKTMTRLMSEAPEIYDSLLIELLLRRWAEWKALHPEGTRGDLQWAEVMAVEKLEELRIRLDKQLDEGP